MFDRWPAEEGDGACRRKAPTGPMPRSVAPSVEAATGGFTLLQSVDRQTLAILD